MRYLPTMIFATSFAATLVAAHAAPRTIDDCEKIQAADAYNQCLAIFGPVAHTHASHAASQAGDGFDANGADKATLTGRAASVTQPRHRHYAHAQSHHLGRKVHWTRRGHDHGHQSAHRHGGGKRLAFSVVSGHANLR